MKNTVAGKVLPMIHSPMAPASNNMPPKKKYAGVEAAALPTPPPAPPQPIKSTVAGVFARRNPPRALGSRGQSSGVPSKRSRRPNRLTWELGCQRSSSAIPGQRFRGQGRSARILRHAFQAHMLRCGLSRLARPWPCDSRCRTQKTCWAVGLIR